MFRVDDIQGNIVKPFKRKHGRFVFLEAREPEVREPLGRLLLRYVTSAEEQARTPQTAAMLGLSASGFARLQLPAAVTEMRGAETKSFQAGMKNLRYWNSRIEHWEPDYLTRSIDAFLLFADDDADRLQSAISLFEAEIEPFAGIVRQEPVKSIRDSKGHDYEHFGFRDDVTKGIEPDRVLLPETWSDDSDQSSHGCFAVVMKIEQHADRFTAATNALSAAAAASGIQITPDEVAERIIGRRRTGEPLVDGNVDPENFSFEGVGASQCPYQAHVRVMNPRDGKPDPVIIRRGMTYGPADNAEGARGLLFMSLHRSIMDFTSLMFRAESSRDPVLSTTADWTPHYTPPNGCLVGRLPGQKWEFSGQTVCYPIANLTTIRGGEYFYIPSLSFIRMMAGQLTRVSRAV